MSRLRTFMSRFMPPASPHTSEDNPTTERSQWFIEQVDFLIEYFEWDPTLPEFTQLKDYTSEYLTYNPLAVLKELNPWDSARVMNDGSVVIFERVFGGVMRVEHIAERLVNRLHGRASKIVANNRGVTIYSRHDRVLVTFQAGAIDPNRLADPGNRYGNAAYIIKRYSGQEFDAMKLVGRARAITVTRQEDGTWSTEFEYAPGREPVEHMK